MSTLPVITLPLSKAGPLAGFTWEERDDDMSLISSTTAFNIKEIYSVDCVAVLFVGIGTTSNTATLLRSQNRMSQWSKLKVHHWVPPEVKSLGQHEPRNGILMCSNHHKAFDSYEFFIRYLPSVRKFLFMNFSGEPEYQIYHGKAIALSMEDHHVPFPSLFIIHEMRVRGFHPFKPTDPPIPSTIPWQDWICNGNSSFDHDGRPPDNGEYTGSHSLQFLPTTSTNQTLSGETQSGGRTLGLNADGIAEILAVTHAMPSWKTCVQENTSWVDTAKKNIAKYVSSVGSEETQPEEQ